MLGPIDSSRVPSMHQRRWKARGDGKRKLDLNQYNCKDLMKIININTLTDVFYSKC